MSLTLGNSLSSSSARTIESSTRLSSMLGQSMSSGLKKNNSVLDNFQGNSLRDNQFVLNAIHKNTSYTKNLLDITDNYYNAMASSLQEGLGAITSAGPLSQDKLAVLQQSLNNCRKQIEGYISTAKFDSRQLFVGQASNIDVQTGTGSSDKIQISVKDISAGKLFRSSVTTALNDYVYSEAKAGRFTTGYYANLSQVEKDLAAGKNLFLCAINNAGGSGTGGAMPNNAMADAIRAVVNAKPEFASYLNEVAPLSLAQIQLVGGANTRTFADGTQADYRAATGNGPAKAELTALFADNVTTSLATPVQRTEAAGVFQRALDTIRASQADLANQRNNIQAAADAINATAGITEQVADSYLKTDYVKTVQEFSELLKRTRTAIYAMQANNKIADAAEDLVRDLR